MINEFAPGGNEFIEMVVVGSPCEFVNIQGIIIDDNNGAVSYTHLTLPTICSV